MAEEFTIDISPDGNDVKFEGHGIEGPDCKALTKDIEEALGTPGKVMQKPEYHRVRTARRTRQA